MSIQIKLKNSVVQDSTPSTSDLPEVGELAVNANINSIGGFMRASNNTIVKIFGPGSLSTPTATTTVSGISELATNTETTTGTATNRVVTPAGLNAVTVAERTTSNNNYVAKAGSTMTGPLLVTNGSTSANSISASGDANTGFNFGTDTVNICTGGLNRLTVNSAGETVTTSNLLIDGNGIRLKLGDAQDFQLYHTGSTNKIQSFVGDIELLAPTSKAVLFGINSVEKARIDSGGKLLVGTSTARTNFFNLASTHTPRFQIESTNNDDGRAALGLIYGKTNASGPYIVMAKHRSNTVGDNTVVQSGDETGIIAFQGSDGTQFVDSARIQGFVDGTPGADDMPGRLVFSTTADGASTPTDRLTIDSAGLSTFTGSLKVSNTEPQIFLTDTNNNSDFKIRVQNGVFLIEDTTNNNADRFQIGSSGIVDIFGNLNVGAAIDVTGGITGSGDLTIDTNTFKVDSTNNRVGIGTASPTEELTISSATPAVRLVDTDQANSYIQVSAANGDMFLSANGASSNGKFIFRSGNGGSFTEHLRLDSSGRLMIGTTVEGNGNADTLTIATSADSGMTIRSGSSSAGQIFFSDATSGNAEFAGFVQYLHNQNSLNFGTDETQRMMINNVGNVGIGTTSLVGNAANIYLTVNGSTLGGIALKANGTNQGYLQGTNSLIRLSSDGAKPIVFDTNGSERMRIDSAGDVGINRTDPTAKLHIVESTSIPAVKIKQGLNSNQNAALQFFNDNGTGTLSLGVFGSAATTFGANEASDGFITANNQLSINAQNSNGQIRFGIGSTPNTKMLIDSSGRVAIGTTSPQSHNIYGDNLVIASTTDTGMTISGNDASTNFSSLIYSAGTTVRGYIDQQLNSTGRMFLMNTANGFMGFGTNNAERMRIDSAGRVGIGTSNIGSHQLLVSGGKAETGGSSIALKTDSVASGTKSDLALYGTFVSPTSDTGTRRTADIISGFSTANWGTEFLSFNVGKSGASNDTQQVCDERMRITSYGDVVLNSTVARGYNGHTPKLSVQGVNFSQSTVAITNNSTGADGAYLFFAKQRSGSVGGSTSVANNDIVGQFRYLAGDGTDVESEVANITVSIDGAPGSNDTPGRITFATTNDGGNVSTERFRIDQAGNKFLGNVFDTTSTSTRKSYFTSNGQQFHGRNAHEAYIVFQDTSNNNIGTITRGAGSSIAFNTTSDYRLKENVVDLTNAITRLKTLSPKRFNFKSEPSITIDGFLAHEVTAVPEAIEGEKDGVITQEMLDAGTLEGKVGDPIYQGIDQSKLVPLLVAAVQELIGKVEALEAA